MSGKENIDGKFYITRYQLNIARQSIKKLPPPPKKKRRLGGAVAEGVTINHFWYKCPPPPAMSICSRWMPSAILCLIDFSQKLVQIVRNKRSITRNLNAIQPMVIRTDCKVILWLNPLTAKFFNLNFHPFEVVSCWRDPQLQVSENYSDLTKWRSTLFKYWCHILSLTYLKCGT